MFQWNETKLDHQEKLNLWYFVMSFCSHRLSWLTKVTIDRLTGVGQQNQAQNCGHPIRGQEPAWPVADQVCEDWRKVIIRKCFSFMSFSSIWQKSRKLLQKTLLKKGLLRCCCCCGGDESRRATGPKAKGLLALTSDPVTRVHDYMFFYNIYLCCRYLETVGHLIVDDLRVARTACPPCFPPHYDIYDKFVMMYHTQLASRVRLVLFASVGHTLEWKSRIVSTKLFEFECCTDTKCLVNTIWRFHSEIMLQTAICCAIGIIIYSWGLFYR